MLASVENLKLNLALTYYVLGSKQLINKAYLK